MRVSRSGLVVAAAYTALAIGSVVWGHSLTDPKESTVLMQLPVVPVMALLVASGLVEWAAALPLIVFYALCIPLVALGLYAVCLLFGALGLRTRLVIGLGVLVVLSVPLFWSVRQSVGVP